MVSIRDLGFNSKKEVVEWLKSIKEEIQDYPEEEICISDILSIYLEDVKQENEYYFNEFKFSSISEEWPGENEVMWDQTQLYGLEAYRCEQFLEHGNKQFLSTYI